jgi:hypothetical protein
MIFKTLSYDALTDICEFLENKELKNFIIISKKYYNLGNPIMYTRVTEHLMEIKKIIKNSNYIIKDSKLKHKDWFDDPYESATVKNSHLINVYRPIGVDTIGCRKGDPPGGCDIRGPIPVPKYTVSPWLNSSYEPDTNLRNQSLCY